MVKSTRIPLLLVLAIGCGPDADRYPLLRPEATEPDPAALADEDDGPTNFIEDDPLEDWDETDAGPLTGIFAVEVVAKAEVIIELEFRQLLRMRLLQRGRTVRVKSQLCRLLLPTIEGVAELTIPLAVERLLRDKAHESEGEYLSASAPIGATFTPSPFRSLVGAALADPVADPLPTAADPTAAADEDGDGNPGVSLSARTLLCDGREQAYVALRTSATLTGVVESARAMAGTLDVTLEQSVLGISAPCMAAAAELEVKVLPGSTFRAVRVGPEHDVDHNGNVTCGEVVAHAPTLFGGAGGD
jgi:hypothetical protein